MLEVTTESDDLINIDHETTSMFNTINEVQFNIVYKLACKNCKRCIPNIYVQGRYEMCNLYMVRSELEPNIVAIEASKGILTNCPFS